MVFACRQVAEVRADSRFKGYKPEPDGIQPVRKPITQVPADGLERLRHLRDVIRKMPLEAVYEMLDKDALHAKLTLVEAVALANETGKLMVPNSVIDEIQTKTNFKIPCTLTGTVIIYEAPDKPFAENAIYIFYDSKKLPHFMSFKVPKEFQGKANCALVVEHPDFDVVLESSDFDLLDLGNNSHQLLVPDESQVHLIEYFPKTNGTYHPDKKFGIPQADMVGWKIDTGHLWRRHDSSYIGPVVRGCDGFYSTELVYSRDSVNINLTSFYVSRFGVALI